MNGNTIFLTNKDIATILKELQHWLEQHGLEEKSRLLISLSVEELLLRWQDHFGPDHAVTFSLGQRFKQPYMILSLEGEEFDPTSQAEDDIDLSARLFGRLGLAPEYTYRRGTNRLSLRIKKQSSSSSKSLLLAILASLLLGICGNLLFPKHITSFTEGFLVPLRTSLLSLISAVAVPTVFLSVLLGICESGSASEFGKIGNKLLLGFVVKTILLTTLFALAFFSFFSLKFEKTTFSMGQLSGTFQMILDILPKNIVEPFAQGNTLQVIVLAIALGLALLVLGEQVNELKVLIKKAYSLTELLLQWVCRLISLLVFLILLETIWTSDLGILLKLWKPVAFVVFCSVATVVLGILRTAGTYKFRPRILWKKLFPSLLITVTTASSAAALGECLECCQHKLGIDRKITCFGIPTGAVMYMPVSAVYFLMCIFHGAEQFHVPCSIAWLILACITSSLLAVAVPPIPGGAMACYTILFLQMGIPAEAIVFAIAMDIIIDRIDTTANIALLQLHLIRFADKFHMLDRNALSKPE